MVHVQNEIAQLQRLLIEVFGQAPHITALDGLEVGHQWIQCHQFVQRVQLAVDDAVVDQHIGVHCTMVEGFHLNIDGGLSVVLRRFVEGDIVAAGDGDALRHIVRGFADVYSAAAGDVEKCHGLAGGLLLQYVRHAVHLLIK